MIERPPFLSFGLLHGVGHWLKTAGLSFATGFTACLITLPMLLQAVDGDPNSNIPRRSNVASTPAQPSGGVLPVPGDVLVATSSGAADAASSRQPTRLLNVKSPSLQVATRSEVEVGRATPIPIALDDAAAATEGALLALHDVPHGLAIFPATPLASGVWTVNLRDAKDLQAVRYIHDPVERAIEARLLGQDGTLLAKARMTLVARSLDSGGSVSLPDTSASSVMLSSPRDDGPPTRVAARPAGAALPAAAISPPVVAFARLSAGAQAATAARSFETRLAARPAKTVRASRAISRKPMRAKSAVGRTRIAATPLVWPGDPTPRRIAGR